MRKSYRDMSYPELLAERERVIADIRKTKSRFLKRDYRKYLTKLNNEIEDYEFFIRKDRRRSVYDKDTI